MKNIIFVMTWFVFTLISFSGYEEGIALQNPDREIKEMEVRKLINELSNHEWRGAVRQSVSPTTWAIDLTPPMKKILDIGPIAQSALLEQINNPLIKDQVIVLLGGVGDERVIEPIINAMIDADRVNLTDNGTRINFSADIALTNITTAEVAWSHGGGNIFEHCIENRKMCWRDWWGKNRHTFSVQSLSPNDRDYGNYPGYGIYQKRNR